MSYTWHSWRFLGMEISDKYMNCPKCNIHLSYSDFTIILQKVKRKGVVVSTFRCEFCGGTWEIQGYG